MSTKPIGMFDSGVGGTSILMELHTLMPNENYIYLADSKNAPYGNKTKEEILQLSVKNSKLLIEKGCKIIVVACNTATTNAISHLRSNYNVPFIGIEPAIKPAALHSKTKAVGILATKGTLSSDLFHNTSSLFTSGIKVIEQVGEGIVPLIEAGKLYSPEMEELLKSYLEPMLSQDIDYLVLGCTHYPYLIPILNSILPREVKIIDSGLAVARQTQTVLKTRSLINKSQQKASVKLFTNGNLDVLKSILADKFETSYLDF
ncbi:glutamate racemase [Winogradskyella aurantia]|uniref:Glutamate racemase n=1 Tax=Winogradskyella aurantia TaxID=1915063 RepID=A0A265UPK3_9FLAO|nr:glutamate racemase [Winogradskyella aurantia]OZV67251.1 glutamate racemase [Winogradskyella aurantia]